MDMNKMIIQPNDNNQNTPIIVNNNEQNQDLNSPLLPNQTNTMNQINYDRINDNHINNYGYFYINDNPFFELMNQEKIKINSTPNIIKIIIFSIIFIIVFIFSIYVTVLSKGYYSLFHF